MAELEGNQHSPNPRRSILQRLDEEIRQNPWYPRVIPFFVYAVFIAVIQWGLEISVFSYPLLYLLQCITVGLLLWRYRKLLPELTLSFHWLAVPTGVGLLFAWIALGRLMVHINPDWFGPEQQQHYLQELTDSSVAIGTAALGMRLLGMSILVPMFEELFIRSTMLRALNDYRRTGIGVLQILTDMPLIGDWLIHTSIGRRVGRHQHVFTKQLVETPLGSITVFGVAASTVVFMVSHVLRDWPGCIACGVTWCLLLWYTNRPNRRKKLGLGPVIWSHGITNALLWAYSLYTNDWQFM